MSTPPKLWSHIFNEIRYCMPMIIMTVSVMHNSIIQTLTSECLPQNKDRRLRSTINNPKIEDIYLNFSLVKWFHRNIHTDYLECSPNLYKQEKPHEMVICVSTAGLNYIHVLSSHWVLNVYIRLTIIVSTKVSSW